MSESELSEARLEGIVQSLLSSYDLDRRPGPRLPAREAIVSVIEQVRRLLFPGYYSDEALPAVSRAHHVGTWVCGLHASLARVVSKAIGHEDDGIPKIAAQRRGREIATDLLVALPCIREQLRADAEAAVDGDPAASGIEEVILTYPGFLATSVHRVAHWLYGAGVPYVPRAMNEHAHALTGIDIHPGARIGRRFFVDHGTGVVVGETTEIGDDVKIYQGVTLGALSVSRDYVGTKRHPTIEDRVVLYAGATVLGGETVIGEGSVIGGNVWITESVAPGTKVIESPPTLDYRTPDGEAAG